MRTHIRKTGLTFQKTGLKFQNKLGLTFQNKLGLTFEKKQVSHFKMIGDRHLPIFYILYAKFQILKTWRVFEYALSVKIDK